MNQDELDAAFKKHFAKRGKRERGMIERAIWWVATKPWIMSATGYTRAYRVAMDFDDMEAILRWFNDIGEIIDRYYGKPVFGLHLEWAFVDRDGKSAKCLRLRQRGGLGSGILHYLAASNKTLMREPPLPLSDEERALRAGAQRPDCPWQPRRSE
jgi:hypothetical protein